MYRAEDPFWVKVCVRGVLLLTLQSDNFVQVTLSLLISNSHFNVSSPSVVGGLSKTNFVYLIRTLHVEDKIIRKRFGIIPFRSPPESGCIPIEHFFLEYD